MWQISCFGVDSILFETRVNVEDWHTADVCPELLSSEFWLCKAALFFRSCRSSPVLYSRLSNLQQGSNFCIREEVTRPFRSTGRWCVFGRPRHGTVTVVSDGGSVSAFSLSPVQRKVTLSSESKSSSCETGGNMQDCSAIAPVSSFTTHAGWEFEFNWCRRTLDAHYVRLCSSTEHIILRKREITIQNRLSRLSRYPKKSCSPRYYIGWIHDQQRWWQGTWVRIILRRSENITHSIQSCVGRLRQALRRSGTSETLSAADTVSNGVYPLAILSSVIVSSKAEQQSI